VVDNSTVLIQSLLIINFVTHVQWRVIEYNIIITKAVMLSVVECSQFIIGVHSPCSF